jgi:hypothetical protein
MLFQPPLELFPPPAFGQIGAEHGNGSLECWATKKPRIVVTRLMAIWTIDAPAEAIGKVAERERVACVQLYLEIGLTTVGGERPLADDETHNVPNVELSHGPILARCSALEQSHVARCLSCGTGMSHVAHMRRARQGGLFEHPVKGVASWITPEERTPSVPSRKH